MSFRFFENPSPLNLAGLVVSIVLACCLAACSHPAGEVQAAPVVVADHGLLQVPEKSPLRSELVVQPVEMRDVPHAMVFPATVEADPARMANVLPSLTGKVVELKVGLGDRVTRGQLLAVIDSGDLAQAYADADKAREAGLPGIIASGTQFEGLLLSHLVDRLGDAWYAGGTLDAKIIKSVYVDDVVTPVIQVKSINAKEIELDVWCENQRGEKTLVGQARVLHT